MVPTWLKSLFSRRTTRKTKVRRTGPIAKPNIVQLEDRVVPAAISIADATVMETNAGTTTLMFTVTADAAEAADITFKINTTDVTATAGDDYVALSNVSGKINAGATTTTVMVTVNGDTTVELDETFTVKLSNLSAGNNFTDDTAVGTITNDDTATISISSPSVNEGGNLDFVVSISNAVDVDVMADRKTADGTALAASDYNSIANGNITLFAADSTANKTITVTTKTDSLVELDETLSLILSNLTASGRKVVFMGGGASLTGTGTITNDDMATISFMASPSQNEGTALTFTVTIDNPVDVAVMAKNETVDGTAKSASDYTAIPITNITLFNVSSTANKTISVTVSADNLVELDETLSLMLSNLNAGNRKVMFSGGGATLTDTGTIKNNDSATITVANSAASEGAGVSFTATLTNPVDTDITIDLTPSKQAGNNATETTDFSTATQTITILAGQISGSTMVATVDDDTVELDETFTVTLGNLNNAGRSVTGNGATAVGTISNEDTATVSIADSSATEGAAVMFTATITNPVDVDVTIKLTPAKGGTDTATNTTDFSTSVQTITILAGQLTGTASVTTVPDNIVEANETFTGTLSNLAASGRDGGGMVISILDATGTGTINNDDVTVLSINDVALTENNTSMMFTITSSKAVQGGFTVKIQTMDGTAIAPGDYDAGNATLNFSVDGTGNSPAGQSKTFTVGINEDLIVEPTQMFTVFLSNLAPNIAATPLSGFDITDAGVGTINEDGDTAQFSVQSDITATEGNPLTFNILLSAQVEATTSVTLTTVGTSGNPATPGVDFVDATGTVVTFNPLVTSQLFMVASIADGIAEPAEKFNFTIGGLNNGGLAAVTLPGGGATKIGRINNNNVAVFSIADVTAIEGNSLTFTINLSTAVAVDTSVKVTTTDITANSSDYTGVTDMLVSFPAGMTSKTVTIMTTSDTIVEADETFKISLGGLDDGGLTGDVIISATNGSAIGKITNDDSTMLTIDDVMVLENVAGGLATFKVTLTNGVQGGFKVDLKSVNGTASASSDFTAPTGTLTFAGMPNESQMFTVAITNENLVEADETFTVGLMNVVPNDAGVSAAKINATDTALGTIQNDDSALVSITKTASAIEGNKITFTVSLSNPVDVTTTVKVSTADISATGGTDYTTLSGVLVTFNPTVQNQSVMVSTTADNIVETDETFSISLGSLNNNGRPTVTIDAANSTGTGTITNDDKAAFSIADAKAVEGGMITFTVTLSNPVSTDTSVTVTTADMNAIDGVDYTGLVAQTVMFPALSTSQQFKVATTVDTIVEADETFKAMLGGLNDGGFPGEVTISGTSGTAVGTIQNDDSTTLTIGDVMQAEAAGKMTFTVTLGNGVQGGFTVLVNTANGTATVADGDYGMVSGTMLTFAGTPGETQSFDVNIIDDTKVEADETFSVSSTGAVTLEAGVPAGKIANGSATGKIVNDDAAQFSIMADSSIVEGGMVKFVVLLSNPVDVATSVTLSSTDGTAKTAAAPAFDKDFTAQVGTLVSFGANVQSVNVLVPTLADNIVELDEMFSVALGGLNTGGRPTVSIDAGNSTRTGTITNDDSAQFKINAASNASEGGKITFTVSLTNPVDVATSVTVTTADGTAMVADNDYGPLMGQTINFAALDTSETFEVSTINDDVVEADETFTANLGGLVDGGRTVTISAADMTGTGTILNNDLASLSIADVAMDEATGMITFTVLLTGDVQGGFSVDIKTADGTAMVADSDYVAGTQTLVFAGNSGETQQFTVTVNDDNKVEADETFTVSLFNVAPNDAKVKAADIGSSDTATGTIRNDDSTTLTIADVSQAEGAGKMTFTVVLSNPVQGGLKVNFATSDGSAKTSDNDYDANSGTLTFAGNANEMQTFMVTVNDDATIEPDEFFNVGQSNVVTLGAGVMAAKVDATDVAVGNITTDDKAEINLFASTDTEGNNLIYTITLSNKISKDVSVDFATLAGVGVRPAISGVDFTAVAKTVTFMAGSTKETIVVPLTDDRRVEGSEQFDSQITNIQADASVISALFFGKALDTATITDNDTVSVNFTSAGGGAMEDNIAGVTATVQLTVTAVGAIGVDGIDRTVVVRVSDTVGGTATNNADYKNFTNPTDLIFAKADFTTTSQNIGFDLIEDLNKEGDETIIFGIALQTDDTAGQASIGATAKHTFSIGSDDEAVRTYDASVAGDYRFVNDGAGNVQLFQGANLLSTDAIGTQAIRLNGTAGVDSATIDYSNGSMVPSGGISFNGGAPTAGERFIVSKGTFASAVNTFTGAESATLVLTGTTTDNLSYLNVDAAELNATSVGNLTLQLPAAASDAILEDDGIPANGVSQIRSGNGTFATTKFVNPTGTLTVATGNAADTLTIASILDTTSTILAGSAANRFATIAQNGSVGSNGDVRFFSKAIAMNGGSILTAAKTVELNATDTVTLDSTAIAANDFNQTGGSKVSINAAAFAKVSGAATINFDGTIDGPGSLETAGAGTSTFQQPIGTGTTLATAKFGSKINATATGSATVTGGITGGRFNVRANTIALNAALDATGGPVVLRLTGGGATQSAPITATKLYLEGSGAFALDNAANQLTGDGKTIASFITMNGTNTVTDEPGIQALNGDLFAKLSSGSILVRDKTDFIIRFEDATQQPAIAITGGGNVTLTSGGDVSIEDKRSIDPTVKSSDVANLLSVGSGKVQVNVGVDREDPAGPTTIVRFLAEAAAGLVTLGSAPTPTDNFDIRSKGTNFADPANLENIAKDTFTVRPALGSPLLLNGNSPIVTDPIAFRPYDSLSPRFAGTGSINLIPMGNGNGTFNFGNGFKSIQFTSIENIGGIQANALVVQTGPSVSSPANNYALRLNAQISGQPFGSALSGNGIVTNPFVVTPSLGGVSQFNAPQITFADVDGDTTPDLIIANGTGDAPLVTIVRGSRLFGGNNINLSALNPETDIISQFFAFEETFRGGVQVRAADFNGDGKAELAVSPGIGGGPRIIVYQIDQSKVNVFNNAVFYRHKLAGGGLSNPYNFFPYESTFRGGVNVAVGDVNGDGVPDIVAGAGFGGGPRVRVYDGSIDPTLGDGTTINPASTIADFFAYDPNFRGGVFVDAGRFDADTITDLVTAPGPGGSAHIQVFQGRKNAQPFEVDAVRGDQFRVAMASFFAFEDTPDLTNPLPSRTGVGGISFGTSTDNLGSSRSILVTRPEGTRFEIVRFDPVLPGDPLTPDDIKNNATVFPITPTLNLKRTPGFETILAALADPNNLLPFNVLLDGGSAAGSA